MDAVAHSAGRRQAGNSNCLAAERVSLVLALEKQGKEVGATLREPGDTRADPADEHWESTMGSATDSWGVAETRNSDFANDDDKVHGATWKAALTNLAHLS